MSCLEWPELNKGKRNTHFLVSSHVSYAKDGMVLVTNQLLLGLPLEEGRKGFIPVSDD